MYQYKVLKRLSYSHKTQLDILESDCHKQDGTRACVCRSTEQNYRRDIPVFYLCYDNTTLIAFLSLFVPGNEDVEITACVHPDYRRQGIFTNLLQTAKQKFSSQVIHRWLFLCEPADTDSIAVMNHKKALLYSSEYQMLLDDSKFSVTTTPTLSGTSPASSASALSGTSPASSASALSATKPASSASALSGTNPSSVPEYGELLLAEKSDLPVISQMEAIFFGIDPVSSTNQVTQSFSASNTDLYKYVYQDKLIGTASIYHTGSISTIFSLGILPEYRGYGLGKHLLVSLLSYLPSGQKVILQVSGNNTAALHLYKETGFHIYNQQDYWLLP